MKNAAGHLELGQVLEDLQDTIDTTDRFNSLTRHIDHNNSTLEQAIKEMSQYCNSDSEVQLARFGDRVSIIVGLALGGKLEENEAFNEIKIMYKDLKKMYKHSKSEDPQLKSN